MTNSALVRDLLIDLEISGLEKIGGMQWPVFRHPEQ
jgi:hypothetical protein